MAVSAQRNDGGRRQPAGQPGTLSPQRAAEMSQGNSRRRGARGTSEETHSMGSSFSDLDGEDIIPAVDLPIYSTLFPPPP